MIDLLSMMVPAVGLVGLFGWSHAALRRKIFEIEKTLSRLSTDEEIRIMVADKLAPIKVEYRALSSRIKDLQDSQKELAHKIDRILECVKR